MFETRGRAGKRPTHGGALFLEPVIRAVEEMDDVLDVIAAPAQALLGCPDRHDESQIVSCEGQTRHAPVHLGGVAYDAMVLVEGAATLEVGPFGAPTRRRNRQAACSEQRDRGTARHHRFLSFARPFSAASTSAAAFRKSCSRMLPGS